MSELWRNICKRAEQYPQASALSESNDGTALSYGEMVQRVESLSSHLHRLNTGTIGILADNGIDWVVSDLAGLAAGRCLVPVPLFFSDAQREHALDDAVATWLLAASNTQLPESYEPVDSVPGLRDLIIWKRTATGSKHTLPEGTAKITYTSGSTGAPKGVCLGEKLIAEVAETLASATSDIDVRKHLCVLPLAILLENIAGIYTPLLRGAEIVVPSLSRLGLFGSSQLDPNRFLETLSNVRPESMILIPQLLDGLLQATRSGWHPPDSFQFIAVGGGHVSRQLLDEAEEAGLPVYQGYGLSECGSVVSLNLPGQNRAGSVGKPLAHASISIIDGEIHIDKQLFLGYTDGTTPDTTSTLATGDLGFLDDEGFLHINGRKKNVLITSFGRNISPEWVEAELNTIPGVFHSMVVGEAQPSLGALIAAAPALDDQFIDTAIGLLNATLPDYAQIGSWSRLQAPFSVNSGTLTENGRLKREVILEKFREQIDFLFPNQYQSDNEATHRFHSTQSE